MDSNDLPEVERIFEEAFPANEKIFSIKQLIEKSDEMNISVSSIMDEDKLVGLTVIINNDEWNYLMHFAIDSNIRGGGYGSRAMKSIMDYCGDKTLIFVIEAPDEKLKTPSKECAERTFTLKIICLKVALIFLPVELILRLLQAKKILNSHF